jgi:hypothetical protein
MKLPQILLLSLLATAVTISSCKKEEDEPHDDDDDHHSTSTDVHIDAVLHLHAMVDTNAFQFNTDYTDDFGNVYQFTRAEFYVSGAHFKNHDHNIIGTSSEYLLVSPAAMMYSLGTIHCDEAHLHEMAFNVGIDSLTNHSDPATFSGGHALEPQNPAMHWGWSTGYKFVVLEGMVDTDSDNVVDAVFQYHLGTDALLREAEVQVHTDIVDNTTVDFHLNVDYGAWFTGIDLSANLATHTTSNIQLATQAVNNTGNVFAVHH